ncbi:MAG TPA: glycosyl hydrolase, partial [bacterium]
ADAWWPGQSGKAVLPEMDPFRRQTVYVEVFNRGRTPFTYRAKAEKPWIRVHPEKGNVSSEERVWIDVDWEKAPAGKTLIPIVFSGPNRRRIVVQAVVNRFPVPEEDMENRFIETSGTVSIEAEHYSRAVNTHPVTWQRIPDFGRTLSGMTPFPVTAPPQSPQGDSPRLEYQMLLSSKGEVRVKAYLSPTLNFHDNGLRYAISFDDEPAVVVNMHEGKTFQDWEESVRNNVTVGISRHAIAEPGKHVLKFWAVDPGVVLQKLVVETGEAKPSYLGPPESVLGSVGTR